MIHYPPPPWKIDLVQQLTNILSATVHDNFASPTALADRLLDLQLEIRQKYGGILGDDDPLAWVSVVSTPSVDTTLTVQQAQDLYQEGDEDYDPIVLWDVDGPVRDSQLRAICEAAARGELSHLVEGGQ
jgi:hypothetical protein